MKSLADCTTADITPAGQLIAAENTPAAVLSQQETNPSPSLRDQPKTTGRKRAVIRENFSFPPSDSELIEILRKRAAREGVLLNRSELLRAGLAALSKLSDAEIATVGGEVPKLKTGRPKSA